MSNLQQQFQEMTDEELKRFLNILDSIEQKLKLGMSYSSEIYALHDEFHFSDADLLDIDSMLYVAKREASSRWQNQ